jgi:hypothetical protein
LNHKEKEEAQSDYEKICREGGKTERFTICHVVPFRLLG